MGDVRFVDAYERVRDAEDGMAAIRELHDAQVIKALGAAASEGDEYLANVLTTEALNRQRRLAALFAAVTLGAAFFVTLRVVMSVVFAVQEPRFPEPLRLALTIGFLLVGAVVAIVAYVRARNQTATVRA